MKKVELIFVPSPGVGHLASAVEAAKLLLHTDDRISITVFVFKRSSDSNFTAYSYNLTTTPRLRFFNLPMVESQTFNLDYMEPQTPQVRQAVSNLFSTSGSPPAGFVLDMFCTPMMDVAREFGVPSYIYFASNAAFLGFLFHVQLLRDEHQIDLAQAKDPEAELTLPTFTKPYPARVLPSVVLQKEFLSSVLNHTRRYREAKGILVNSFTELESHVLDSLSQGNNPPVYPVGPILNLGSDENNSRKKEIMDWLDDQPSSSVVFLCFGSKGALSEEQVKEIACALDHSKHRFLWSLRRPPPKEQTMIAYPAEYENLEEVLPVGFLDRTVGVGKIIGWAPQTAILGHPAIGGFVSHCGWNSTLESLWFGVPIAAWPLRAEQQLNAFELVKELELAAEIKMDYRKEDGIIVKAEEIERGIRCVMEQDSKIRKNAREISEKSKMVLMEGGSSISALNRFIEDVMDNVSK
ncbi:anthocyanidin 3-O-glucosyltransferase 2-like [Euphorbia lathyris]|uniref:anthocyanidin 3-O-glucosyltransferase 2-like n=1 Tax=Euphorbia lathyris TaxID=212925 RepID=UPI0033142E9D